MTLSFSAVPAVQFAADTSTLRASLDNLSNATTPTGPFFFTGQAAFASTPTGTHAPPIVPLTPADVSAESAYAAGTQDPDELRTTVDRQTIPIRISRPPEPDVVPVITTDDPTPTPGQRIELLVGIINHGDAPAERVRACIRLDQRLDTRTGLCQSFRRLVPGRGVYRRIGVGVRRDACAGRLTHRLDVTSSGQRARTARAHARLLAGPCRIPPCPRVVPTQLTRWPTGLATEPVRARLIC